MKIQSQATPAHKIYHVTMILTLAALLLFGLVSSSHGGASRPITNSIGMEFVLIPAGSFMMGNHPGDLSGSDKEVPQHRVQISRSFYLQTTEVTQGQWKAVMGTEPWQGKKYAKSSCSKCAVTYVSWKDAQEFILRLNQKESTNKYRLPTEAQSEYARRAGTTSRFSFGDSDSQLDQYAWHGGNAWNKGEKYAHEVGGKEPNKWGLLDMHGNVYEWCSDWYGKYSSSPTRDPQGPSSGERRVLRGGSWGCPPKYQRSAFRLRKIPTSRSPYTGFRVAMD